MNKRHPPEESWPGGEASLVQGVRVGRQREVLEPTGRVERASVCRTAYGGRESPGTHFAEM